MCNGQPTTLYLLGCIFMCYFEDNAVYDINTLNLSTLDSNIFLQKLN